MGRGYGSSEFNAGGSPTMDQYLIQGERGGTPSRFMLNENREKSHAGAMNL